MAKYIIQGETLKAIADEVRDLTDITDEINPSEMIANMEQVNADVAAQMEIIEQIRTALDSKAGSNAAEIGALIDNSGVLDSTEGTVEEKVEQLVENKKLYDLILKTNTYKRALFADFEGETIPQLNYSQFSSFWYFARNSKITHIDFYINSSSCTDMSDAFSGCKQLKTMVGIDTSKATTVPGMFYECSTLETIGEPLDFNKVTKTNAIFTKTSSLKEIRFVAETIKVSISFINVNLLSAESIQSIIDGLATVETAQTLTLHKDAKILQSQVDSANAKGWTVAGGTVVSEEEYYG